MAFLYKVFISFVLHGFPQDVRLKIIGNTLKALDAGGEIFILDYSEISLNEMPFYVRGLFKRIECPYAFDFMERGRSIRQLVADKILPDISGLYADEEKGVTALIISHAHQDHYGLADYVHPDVPVYASEGTRALIEVSSIFLPHAVKIPELTILEKWKSVQLR